jgi:DNA helicase HerA-like ATPase
MNQKLLTHPGENGVGRVREDHLLGHIDWDGPSATNERVVLRSPGTRRSLLLRNQFVRIEDGSGSGAVFLGRILAGPFFPAPVGGGDHPDSPDAAILADIEVQGELTAGRPHDTSNRPAPGAAVYALAADEVNELLGCAGDMLLGTLAGREDLTVALQSANKEVLPRNVGIFGTVGSGKSNTTQVLIEEAAARDWAVIVLDVEGEYVAMDAPCPEQRFVPALARLGRAPSGVANFHVLHPASCASGRADSQPFTLRLADFEVSVIAELLQASLAERNALLDCVDHFEVKARAKVASSEVESMLRLLDASPQANLPFTVRHLRDRAGERSSRSSEMFDYLGLSTKLLWLMRSGAFDQQNLKGLDPKEMLQPGRVTVVDVSIANDTIKNLVTADLLRKTFAYKIAHTDAPPTVLVIEEAHSFISREKVHTMQATLQMLRNVTRRGRKRWLATVFVSQQPGHLPPEIFELCNTRVVHTLRSMHNLDPLIGTTSDIAGEFWARCPLLGTGEAILSSPQLKRPVIVKVRPASSERKFVR